MKSQGLDYSVTLCNFSPSPSPRSNVLSMSTHNGTTSVTTLSDTSELEQPGEYLRCVYLSVLFHVNVHNRRGRYCQFIGILT